MIPRAMRRPWLLYPAWIVVCAALFVALRGQEDPSRRRDRILSNDAAARAQVALQPTPWRGYKPVHVAFAGAGEDGASARWVVLCDRVPHSALDAAVVVELDARDGRVLRIRKPVN
jgi:hypothetical protein